MNETQPSDIQNRRTVAPPAAPGGVEHRSQRAASKTRVRPPLIQDVLPSSVMFLIAALLGLTFVAAAYRHSINYSPPIDAWDALATGLHDVEQGPQLAYVYTDGSAALRFPEVGDGRFAALLRIGGIPEIGSAATQLSSSEARLALGPLDSIRSFHVLLPSTGHGDLVIELDSAARTVAPDPRPLGVMLLGVAAQPVGAVHVPWPVALTTVGTLALAWLILAKLGAPLAWRGVALAICAAAISGSLALWRGTIALQPLWIGAGVIGVVALWLVELPRRPLLCSRRWALAIVAAWRLGLWLVAGLGLWYGRDIYRYGSGNAVYINPELGDRTRLLWRALTEAWLRWDSEHYLVIATTGYTFTEARWPNVAFFPLYPLLIRLTVPLTLGHAEIAALLIAHAALAAAVVLLYDLVAHDFDPTVAQRSVLLLLAFPSAFFLVAGYTESLALALAVASVWAIRRQRWWLAGFAGLLLSMTRVPGVLIAPVIGICYMQQLRWRWRAIQPPLLSVLLPPLGLALFMAYQWRQFGTPWAFLIAQESWNNGAAAPWTIPQKIWRSVSGAPDWEMALLQLVIWGSFLVLTLLALWRLPLAYGLTGLLLLLPAYTANQRGSLIRHVLIGFPAFVMLARLSLPVWLRWLILTLMLSALVLLTMLFVAGFFVA